MSPTDDVEEEVDTVIEGGNERNTGPSKTVFLVALAGEIENCMKENVLLYSEMSFVDFLSLHVRVFLNYAKVSNVVKKICTGRAK